MSETIKTNQGEVQESTPWDSLVLNSDKTRKAEYLQSKKGQEETAIEDTFDQWTKELDEMVDEGKISKEEAKAQQETMLESAVDGIYSVRGEALRDQQQEAQTNEPTAKNIETKTEESSLDGTTFEVAPGLSKEAEFKRLTGEDWPGVKYTAESNGADEGDDYPIETWTIKERTVEEEAKPEEEKDELDGTTFEVAPGLSKEAEFKRLTGEDWPGTKYTAESNGADEGDDYPIETWTIKKRAVEEKTKENANQEPTDTDTPEATPEPTSNVARDRLNQMREILSKTQEPTSNVARDRLNQMREILSKTQEPTSKYEPAVADIPDIDTRESIEDELAKEKTDLDDLENRVNALAEEAQKLFGKNTDEIGDREKTDKKSSNEEGIGGEKTTTPPSENRAFANITELFGENTDEEDAHLENPEKSKPFELTEKDKLLAEREAILAKLAEMGDAKDDEPLVAVDINFADNGRELARDFAERDLEEEIANSRFIKKLWKGKLFKKHFREKYTREYIESKRTTEINGEKLSIYDIINRCSDDAIEHFVKDAVDLVQRAEGAKEGQGQIDPHGRILVEADRETTSKVRAEIENYARKRPESGENLEDLRRELNKNIDRIIAEAVNEGKIEDGYKVGNYEEVAEKAYRKYHALVEVATQAREKAEHDVAMARVTEGFRLYHIKDRLGKNQPKQPEQPQKQQPEASVTPEQESNRTDGFKKLITGVPDMFGGAMSAKILTEVTNEVNEARNAKWWNSLNEGAKKNIYRVIERINSVDGEDPEWGRKNREWILAQPH